MDEEDSEALVNRLLQLESSESSHVGKIGWDEEWTSMVTELDDLELEPVADAGLEIAPEAGQQQARTKGDPIEELERATAETEFVTDENKDKSCQEEHKVRPHEQVSHHEQAKRLTLLSRVKADLESPCFPKPQEAPLEFVVHLACKSLAPRRRYSMRTLYFTHTTSWPDFYRQLQDQTTNWQIHGDMGCPIGLTPRNGTWKYDMRSKSDTGSDTFVRETALDGSQAFVVMKDVLLRKSDSDPGPVAMLVHSRLQEYHERLTTEHRELCDRTGGSGDNAVCSNGHFFDKTFDLEDWIMRRSIED